LLTIEKRTQNQILLIGQSLDRGFSWKRNINVEETSLLVEARLLEELGFEPSVEWTSLLAAGGLSALVLRG
jgi:hypothetical protein